MLSPGKYRVKQWIRVFRRVDDAPSLRLGRDTSIARDSIIELGEPITMIYDHDDVTAMPLLNFKPDRFVIQDEVAPLLAPADQTLPTLAQVFRILVARKDIWRFATNLGETMDMKVPAITPYLDYYVPVPKHLKRLREFIKERLPEQDTTRVVFEAVLAAPIEQSLAGQRSARPLKYKNLNDYIDSADMKVELRKFDAALKDLPSTKQIEVLRQATALATAAKSSAQPT